MLLFIVFGCPFLILVWPVLKPWPRSLSGRLIVAILTVWGLLIVENHLSLPARLKRAGPNYDGCAASAAALLFGWIIGCIGSAPAAVIALLLKRRSRKPAAR